MTRRVNLSSDQRYDLTDALAEAEFENQDVRRVARHTIIGRDLTTRVIRGFDTTAVDPGVESTIIIKMDQGGGNIGSFMGAENYGGGQIDFGQLVGGKDAQGNLEGAAQLILDFIGQPIGVYEVKLKFSGFVESNNDNRAFWVKATNSEVIRTTRTRLLPQWEAAFQGHADPEWVLVAEVNWQGATIAAADITDKRDFALEGPARDEAVVADRWSHEDQASAANFGVKDFDRGHDRGDPAIIQAGIWENLRAHSRQIQDIKGGRELDGRFDAYSRPYQPAGFVGVQPDEWTKNLRGIDVTTFTIGDGTTEFGDFNGTAGLQECFQYIESNGAWMPNHIRIVVKSRSITPGQPVFTWDTPVVISNKNITLVGRGNGRGGIASEIDGLFEGQTQVEFNNPLGTTALHITGTGGGLHLEHMYLTGLISFINIISVEVGGSFSAHKCVINPDLSGFQGTSLRCPSEACDIDNCIIGGFVAIGGKTKTNPVSTSPDSSHRGGLIRNTLFNTCRLKLRLDPAIDELQGQSLFANRLRFQNCTFLVPGIALFFAAQQYGMVDARGTRNVKFEQCHFQYSGDEDAVRIGTFKYYEDEGGPYYARTENISFEDSQWLLRDSATHQGWVTGAGGASDIEGTGWAIKIHPGAEFPVLEDRNQVARGIFIKNCHFRCADIIGPVVSSPDAGAIYLHDCRDVTIENCHATNWTAPVAGQSSDFVRIIGVQTSLIGLALGSGQNIWIEKNFIGAWHHLGDAGAWGAGGGTLHCIHVVGGNHMQINDNHISAIDKTETALVDPTTFGGALYLSTSNAVRVEGNHFIYWRSLTDPLFNSCVYLDGGENNALNFENNHFFWCGGYNIFADPGASIFRSQFHDNNFEVGIIPATYAGAIFLKCITEDLHIKDNFWDSSFAALIAVHLGTCAKATLMGNYFILGLAAHSTAATPLPGLLGWDVPVGERDLNRFAAYIASP